MDNAVLDMRHAIGLWMTYHSVVCASEDVLHEASIRYPLVEFLERKEQCKGLLEKKHPLFYNRPMDFRWEINDVHYFLEAKYARMGYTNSTDEVQRYFDDICRLYFCLDNPDNQVALFLICGKESDCRDCFMSTDPAIVEMEPEEFDDPYVKRYRQFLYFKEQEGNVIDMQCSLPLERLEQIWEKKHVKERKGIVIAKRSRNYDSINDLFDNFCEDYVTSLSTKEDITAKLLGAHKLTIKFIPTKEQYKDNCIYLYEIQKGDTTLVAEMNDILNDLGQ